MLNCAIVMGRLTADPELRSTPSGISVADFTVAVEKDYVKAGEERGVDFINVVTWRHNAEFVTKHFKKGSLIVVQGRLESFMHKKEGTYFNSLKIVADSVGFAGAPTKRTVSDEGTTAD